MNYKFPKTLGTCADKLYKLKEQRRTAKKVLDLLDEERKALELHIINALPKSRASGVSGKLGCVKVVTDEVPTYQDKKAFQEYVKETGRFDLMQGRLSKAAIQDMWDDDVDIPGIGKHNVIKVSLTKV